MEGGNFLSRHGAEIARLSAEHLRLVAIAMAIAIVAGVPLGILVARRRAARTTVLSFSNIMQTIPSLALFGLLLSVPWLGARADRLTILALACWRFAIRLRRGVPDAPAGESAFQSWAAAATHFLLYVAIFGMPVTGVLARIVSDYGVPHSRITVIPNGIDTARYHPDRALGEPIRAEWGVLPHETLVGVVGRLDPVKDHGTFLAGAARLRSRLPDVRFVLCGRDVTWENAELVELIERHGLRAITAYMLESAGSPSGKAPGSGRHDGPHTRPGSTSSRSSPSRAST